VAVKLQGQLLTWGRELDSREDAIATWDDGLAAFERALGKVCTERDASRVRAEAVQQDFFSQTCAYSSMSKRLMVWL
jgi:hypothetical protein